MTTSYRDHTDRNGRLHQPSEPPTNLQTLQPPKPQQENIRDHSSERQMQTPGNWRSLKTEAPKFPSIFTLARRGLKPISNDSSHILKYILSIRQLILKRYILNPEAQHRNTKTGFQEKPPEFKRDNRVEECQKGYQDQLSKSSEHDEKCPLSACAGFLAKPCDTFY